MQRVKEYMAEKEIAKPSTISSTLKINPARLNSIIGDLEREGFLEKRKSLDRGHHVNTVVLVKNEIQSPAQKNIKQSVVVPSIDRIPGACKTMFESPCFFCNKLETCGEDSIINYYNCPKLNEFISKPL
ncbi:MAG: hypothetical protein Q6373_001545 [Candidatus Sigynarchaeota archaeon]